MKGSTSTVLRYRRAAISCKHTTNPLQNETEITGGQRSPGRHCVLKNKEPYRSDQLINELYG